MFYSLPPWHTLQTSALLLPKESSVSVHFSCLMLEKVSVYPVLFPIELMRRKRLPYLGLSRYILAIGQTEPKQIKPVSLSGSLGYAAVSSSLTERFLACKGGTHRPILHCLASANRLEVCFAEERLHGRAATGAWLLSIALSLSYPCDLRWVFPFSGPQLPYLLKGGPAWCSHRTLVIQTV